MSIVKRRPTLEQATDGLIKIAEDVYKSHFAPPNAVGHEPTVEELNAAVFGFVYAQTLNDDPDIRDIAYHALQKRFGWNDEYIAVEVIGG